MCIVEWAAPRYSKPPAAVATQGANLAHIRKVGAEVFAITTIRASTTIVHVTYESFLTSVRSRISSKSSESLPSLS